jgi:hypothetical protein
MRNLKEIIIESLLDDEDVILKNQDKNIKASIRKFLKDNYHGASSCKISRKPNENGKYIVDCSKSLHVINKTITSLTNNYFEFGKINEDFGCVFCKSLKTLEGAPKEVGGIFYCMYCDSLPSLEGAPEEVKGSFDCSHCNSLTSLKGAPKKVGGNFNCSCCKFLDSLEGKPTEIGGDFYS